LCEAVGLLELPVMGRGFSLSLTPAFWAAAALAVAKSDSACCPDFSRRSMFIVVGVCSTICVYFGVGGGFVRVLCSSLLSSRLVGGVKGAALDNSPCAGKQGSPSDEKSRFRNQVKW
jgi:hypothetical protein